MKTLTELYKQNTLEFGFESNGIELVQNHKVTFNLMQTLGKIFTNMSFQQDGEIKASELMQTLMGVPSEETRLAVRKGLGKHYNPASVAKEIKRVLTEEGGLEDSKEIKEASEDLLILLECQMVASLFEKYLDLTSENKDSETPR